MDPADLSGFTDKLKLLERIIGNKLKEPFESESSAIKYVRRSIVAEIDIILKLKCNYSRFRNQ